MPERASPTRAARAYWMVVTSPENYERTRKRRFTVQGVKSRHRRKAERMAAGDRLCWYLTGRGAFAATATIRSSYFEGREPIWVSEKTGDTYPWRVRIAKDRALAAERAVPAEPLSAGLRFVQRWPAEHWRLAFQGNLHELDAADFSVIERAVTAAERRTRREAGARADRRGRSKVAAAARR